MLTRNRDEDVLARLDRNGSLRIDLHLADRHGVGLAARFLRRLVFSLDVPLHLFDRLLLGGRVCVRAQVLRRDGNVAFIFGLLLGRFLLGLGRLLGLRIGFGNGLHDAFDSARHRAFAFGSQCRIARKQSNRHRRSNVSELHWSSPVLWGVRASYRLPSFRDGRLPAPCNERVP